MSRKYFVMSGNPLSEKKGPEEKGGRKDRKMVLIGVMLSILLIIAASVLGYFVIAPQRPERISVADLGDGNYELSVGGRPYFIKGVCYIPTPIGKGYDYDLWGDQTKPWETDAGLMKQMGLNTVRFYFHAKNADQGRDVIRTFYKKFGIRSAMGHYLNFWDYPPPNYGLPEVRARITEDVRKMVRDYKDEPGILLWILGNENNYSFDRNINPWSTEEINSIPDPMEQRIAKARIYYKFINDLAKEIKRIDPDHPVVMGNGELASIEIAKDLCPDVDILGGIIYTGKSFGSFWKRAKRLLGKPVIMIEFGCDRFNAHTAKEDEDHQALFLKTQWEEIEANRARGSPRGEAAGKGEGNSLGGFVFEWTDEWWKHNEQYPADWKVHNTESTWSNGSYYFDAEADHNMNEEWWGIVGLTTEGAGIIDKRIPKKSYYMLRELWRR